MWIWIIIALVVLGAKPSRANLFTLIGIIAILWLGAYAVGLGMGKVPNTPTFFTLYVGIMVAWLLAFMVIGFIIIWIRGGSTEGASAKGKKLDKEMERIRAEIAARENKP